MIFRIRVALIRRLHILSARYYENTPIGDILYRVEQDVDRVGELGGDVLPSVIRMAIVAVMELVTLGVVNLRLSWMAVPTLPLFHFCQPAYLGRLCGCAE